LATICVPMMMSASPAAIASISAFSARADPKRSDDSTFTRASGNSAATSSASRSTPGPTGASRPSTPQAGQASGIGFVSPHWWQTSRLRNRCSTIRASQ
jgi:hypothetical protein